MSNQESGTNETNSVVGQEVIVIPILNSPIFPGMIAPVVIGENKYHPSLEKYIQKSGHLGLNLVKFKVANNSEEETSFDLDEEMAAKIAVKQSKRKKKSAANVTVEIGGSDEAELTVDENDIYRVGVICRVVKRLRLPDGSVNLLVHGVRRYCAKSFYRQDNLLFAQTEVLEDLVESDDELDAYTRSVINQVKKLSELNPYFNEEMKLAMMNTPSPGALADLVAFAISLDTPEAQDFIETLVVKKRFAKLLVYLKREKTVADIQKKIADEVNDKVGKYQREYFLREQLKVIRQELGMEEDEKSRDVKKIREGIVAAKMPEAVEKIAFEELDKLEGIPDSSPEYTVTRSYLNWLIELPWSKATIDDVEIAKAERILKRDHYGLEKAKERILEFLAVRKLRPKYDGTILCFSGPPGVGKTSLGKSIASALDRKFYRFSLGGMRDEAEIKGHRKTYIGAMPGKLIQALKRVQVNNPVIMLDEIDKMGQSFQGDPASALLEVLDPEQNVQFIDNYLDVPFDLSKVLFIATANYLMDIPEPLLDRMEIIELSGYTLEEKLVIVKKWIIPKQLEKHGLTKKNLILSDQVLKKLISDYAREPGVRSLEQYIAKLCRKVALNKVRDARKPFDVRPENLEKLLGVARFQSEMARKDLPPGVVIGLAWTAYGGDILLIESLFLEGKGFKVTGQLGDVMSESASLAYSYVKGILQKEMAQSGVAVKTKSNEEKSKEGETAKKKSSGEDDEGGNDFLSNHEVHLHLPAGATPKDGPSAGITMALAMYSMAQQRSVRVGVAMTGELSLTGRVLPVGGIKEKVLAAKRAGIHEIILPAENEKDLREVPDIHRKGIKFHCVKNFEEVLAIMLPKKTRGANKR